MARSININCSASQCSLPIAINTPWPFRLSIVSPYIPITLVNTFSKTESGRSRAKWTTSSPSAFNRIKPRQLATSSPSTEVPFITSILCHFGA
ncbi:hypothetical protein EYR41_009695 [Orbilia oligospora]|uniref:Uncharacterized protein n=1 Tax=Orbilia oligospora TaxID=2813651 RepID=A0A7C8PB40_ORBOL|nr:hypothetical protein TWF751_006142 [Orbilia oligospora]TGJ65749.1 hypothetical protein EYR41_009695 [Orbilia oligospora]